ncbi:MAG: fumarylacetoacetate hydrolase family protein [Isosphaeraceae bacterium]
MRIVKFLAVGEATPQIGELLEGSVRPLAAGEDALTRLLCAADPSAEAERLRSTAGPSRSVDSVRLLAPIDRHEVWAAGVTYQRSKEAREEESKQAATFYDLVYRSPRPELFFKATPNRVSGPGEEIRIRRDSAWNVPEPELGVVLSPDLTIVGYTAGNDMSSRDIEGENPLYLPQAKLYDRCCALGPCVTLAADLPSVTDLSIGLRIDREGANVFSGETSTSRLARTLDDLISWLGRDNRFPDGVVLLTGTGIVPPDEFTLKPGDVVSITIQGVGTLQNRVIQGTD